MISGGNATIYVANMDAAVRFYTEVLGLKLTNRFGDRWATIETGPSYWTTDEVGAGLVIGLRPQSSRYPAPGTRGSVMFGLETYKPIEDVVSQLAERGVTSTDVIRSEAGNFVGIEDMDGNAIYLGEMTPEMVADEDPGVQPEAELPSEEDPRADASPALFSGGHATVYVSSMDAAVRFYTEVLGLKLTNRYGDHWASVEAGRSLVIGLHPRSQTYPAPGTKGAVVLGLAIDEPIERVVSRLADRGVRITGDIHRSERNSAVSLDDTDGNALCLWHTGEEPVPQDRLAASGAVRG